MEINDKQAIAICGKNADGSQSALARCFHENMEDPAPQLSAKLSCRSSCQMKRRRPSSICISRSTTNNFLVEVFIFYLLNLATLLSTKARRKVRQDRIGLGERGFVPHRQAHVFGAKRSAPLSSAGHKPLVVSLSSSSFFKSSPKDMFYCVFLLFACLF